MTANQINYAKHQEDVRHNKATEAQRDQELVHIGTQAQAAMRQATIASRSQREAVRHNQEQERVNWFLGQEQQRHNVASEGIASSQLAESIRHSKATESFQDRSTIVQEELGKSQIKLQDAQGQAVLRQAGASEVQARASMTSALAQQIQAQVSQQRQAEDARHNLATEKQAQNQLAETFRSNTVSEAIRRQQNIVAKGQLGVAQGQLEVSGRMADASETRATAAMLGSVAQAVNSGSNLAKSITSVMAGGLKG